MGKLEIKYITKELPLVKEKDKNKKQKHNDHLWVLRGINLSVNDGEAVGIVGANGSGKSMLMRIIAGLEEQTTGFKTAHAKITYAGTHDVLDPSLTGIENIQRAIQKDEVDSFKGEHITNAIQNFTELGQWIYCPVKTYSTSQYARLAMGIAMFLEPDVVLLDDVFGILDQSFYLKASRQVQELKDRGVSFIIADSKSIVIEGFCERTLWLQFGEAQEFGPTQAVVQQYNYALDWYNALSRPEKNDFILRKQKVQMEFEIDSVYEEFKIDQFRHGYTRRDEPRMRKAFYVEKGVDPVYRDQIKQSSTARTKNKSVKVAFWLILVFVVIFGGGYLLAQNKRSNAKHNHQTTSSLVAQTNDTQINVKNYSGPVKVIKLKNGEKLQDIAQKYHTTVATLQKLNDLGSTSKVIDGETLIVPQK